VRTLEVDRANPPPLLRAGLEDLAELPDELERTPDGGVRLTVRGDRPRDRAPTDVVGPQLYVPRGSRVRVEAEVRALEGRASVRLALASPRHGIILDRTEPREITPGAPLRLELEHALDATLNELGPVLFVQPEGQARLVVHRLNLEAELP
jgi:hypothetical protein